jgi:hypothetical protein
LAVIFTVEDWVHHGVGLDRGCKLKIGRTIPFFRITLAMEKQEWKPFRNALSKSEERKMFDEMCDIPKLYASACSNSVQLVPLHPIIISILFHHYKELKECMEDVKQIEGEVVFTTANKY